MIKIIDNVLKNDNMTNENKRFNAYRQAIAESYGVLGYQERKKENVFHKLLAGSCAIITILILGSAVAVGIYTRFFV